VSLSAVSPNVSTELELTSTEAIAEDASALSPRRFRVGRLLGRAGFWVGVAALVAWNAWWAWEHRPLPDLATVGSWIKQGTVLLEQAESAKSQGQTKSPAVLDQEAQGAALLKEAERVLRARLRRSPHDGEARILLAKARAAHKDYLDCAEQLHQVPDWWPSKPEVLLREGQFFLAAGRAKAAEAAWKACIANDPRHPTPPNAFFLAMNELVQLYVLEGRLPEARKTLWWAYEQTTDSVEQVNILMTRIWTILRKEKADEAVVKLRRFVATTPDDFEARLALARAEQAVGRGDEALRLAAICRQERPQDPRVWRDWLTLLAAQGDDEALTAALEQVPREAETEPEIWKCRGMVHERTGDLHQAAEAYRQALQRAPHVEEYYFRLGRVEQRLGAHTQAAEHLQRHKELADARDQLNDAYHTYLDLRDQPNTGPQRSATLARLAALCETLGWPREAEALRRAAASG
jgi:Flp pilus assembly protein TadD